MLDHRAPVLAVLLLPGLAAQDPEDEFSAHGMNVVRIENEAKLRVPLEITDQVWTWLQAHYSDCSWLDRDGHTFTATFGDELFEDVYCDTPDLRVLALKSGVRQRGRVVMSGSAMHKDGRRLLQIKVNRDDPTGLARSEIKFEIEPPRSVKLADDQHPVLGLVRRDLREDCKARLRELGLDPYQLRPVLTVNQNRRRVYLGDQHGAFATLTLDLCTSTSWGADLRWTEIELELNEIRYTEADAAARRAMEAINRTIQQDLQRRFPRIVQDQTPKYNKAFAMIEQATWLPLRRLISWEKSQSDLYTMLGLLLLVPTGVVVMRVRRGQREAAEHDRWFGSRPR